MIDLKAPEYTDPVEYLQIDAESVPMFSGITRSKSVSDLSQVSSLVRTCSLPNLSFSSFESLFENRKRQEMAFNKDADLSQSEDLDVKLDCTESLASLQTGLRIVSANLTKDRGLHKLFSMQC